MNTVAAVGFRPGSPLNAGPIASSSVTVGDFNGDGKADLATLSFQNTGDGTGTLSIALGNGDGTFQPPATYTVGANPSSMLMADFNGDGNPDIAVPSVDNQNNGIVSIVLGNGDGTFRPAIYLPTASTSTSMAVADFNGDGKADLVSTSTGDFTRPGVSVLIGNGDGTFQAPLITPFIQLSFNSPSPMVVGDFNGDGKPDLVVLGFSSLFIMPGNGDGTFQTPLSLNTGAFSFFSSISAGDFNSDGKTDLAVGY